MSNLTPPGTESVYSLYCTVVYVVLYFLTLILPLSKTNEQDFIGAQYLYSNALLSGKPEEWYILQPVIMFAPHFTSHPVERID